MEIYGYPDYFISSYGNVMSCKRGKSKPLILHNDKKGYLRVSLGANRESNLVHRLVAKAFIHNPDNYSQVNHKDTNKKNNKVSNLEWCTNSMNMAHAIENGLRASFKGQLNGRCILSESDVLEIRAKSKSGYSKPQLASEYGVSTHAIKDIRMGRSWTHI